MTGSVIAPSALCVFAALLLGCGNGDTEVQRVPLDGSNAGDASRNVAAAPRITGEAKIALDSGNILFRAKAYDLALAQYRRSARLAPDEVIPLFGVLMVAEARKDPRLADSVRTRIRELNPSASDSAARGHAALIDRHSRATQTTPHPR